MTNRILLNKLLLFDNYLQNRSNHHSSTFYRIQSMTAFNRVNVLDTETTGFSPKHGDRIVEIGIVEVIDNQETGQTFHQYVNPQGRNVGGSYNVHGLSDEFLADQPNFVDIQDAFLQFIGSDPLIIHNASFDMRFLDAEMQLTRSKSLQNDVIDTLELARELDPYAGSHALDSLCIRYGITTEKRGLHSALTDAQLLAKVYLNLVSS